MAIAAAIGWTPVPDARALTTANAKLSPSELRSSRPAEYYGLLLTAAEPITSIEATQSKIPAEERNAPPSRKKDLQGRRRQRYIHR